MITWLRYACHSEVAGYQAAGWTVVADLGPPHAHFAILMQWTGEGEPT